MWHDTLYRIEILDKAPPRVFSTTVTEHVGSDRNGSPPITGGSQKGRYDEAQCVRVASVFSILSFTHKTASV